MEQTKKYKDELLVTNIHLGTQIAPTGGKLIDYTATTKTWYDRIFISRLDNKIIFSYRHRMTVEYSHFPDNKSSVTLKKHYMVYTLPEDNTELVYEKILSKSYVSEIQFMLDFFCKKES